MDADKKEWIKKTPSAQPRDARDPEFIAACLRASASRFEQNRNAANLESSAEAVAPQRPSPRLKAHLNGSEQQFEVSAETLREHEALKQAQFVLTAERDAAIAELTKAKNLEAQVRDQLHTLQDKLTDITTQHKTALKDADQRNTKANAKLTSERDAAIADLTKAKNLEAQVRDQLHTLQDKLTGVTAQHKTALKDADQRETKARAKLTSERDAAIADLTKAKNLEAQVRDQLHTLQDKLTDITTQHKTALKDVKDLKDANQSQTKAHAKLTSERDAAMADLTKAKNLEAQVRDQLHTLQDKLTDITTQHKTALKDLKDADQRNGEARAELETAKTEMSHHESAVKQLRQIITDRDREIEELRLQLLASEEARAADAAEIIDSLSSLSR